MLMTRILSAVLVFSFVLCTGTSALRAADCQDAVARHMVGEALLTAHFVALAEKTGMKPSEINAILKRVAESSAVQEFWITDSVGHAYLTNTGVDFTFSPDSSKQPQASAFWPLINGSKDVVIQGAHMREIDWPNFQIRGRRWRRQSSDSSGRCQRDKPVQIEALRRAVLACFEARRPSAWDACRAR